MDPARWEVHVCISLTPSEADVALISTEVVGECTICMEEGNVQKFRCGHQMHLDCAVKWFTRSRTCPTCREDIHCLFF